MAADAARTRGVPSHERGDARGDGVYTYADGNAAPRFHRLPPFSELDVAELEQAMVAKIVALCHRRGWARDGEDRGEGGPLQAAGGASIQGQVAFGARRGRRVRRLGSLPEFLLDDDEGEFGRARPQGFSLFESPAVSEGDRLRTERLVRYMARPAISLERLSRRKDGLYVYELRTPWRDGTTAVVFSALELIEKLAALVPPKGMHLVRYHGVLAPNAAWRGQIVPPAPRESYVVTEGDASAEPARRGRWRWIPWAELLKRVHAIDALKCRNCGARMVILAYLTQRSVVEAILAARGLPTEPKPRRPARRQQGVFET